MKLIAITGAANKGKTTCIHRVAKMIETHLKTLNANLRIKLPRVSLSQTLSNDIKRTYKIMDTPTKRMFHISFASVGDSKKQVLTSYEYGTTSNIHVIASREKSWVETIRTEDISYFKYDMSDQVANMIISEINKYFGI